MSQSPNSHWYPNNLNGNSSQHQGQNLKSSQKIIQDLNYSYEIFFMMCSTLQSIIQHLTGRTNDYSNKMFNSYDRVNYSAKNLAQLKSQLSIHIFLFQTTKTIWLKENPTVEWKLPNNYPKEAAIQFVNNSLNFFMNKDEKDCYKMCLDILSILDDKLKGLHIQSMDNTVKYTEEERQKHKQQLFNNSLQANNVRQQIAKSVENIQNVNELQANLNLSSSNMNLLEGFPSITGKQANNTFSYQQNNPQSIVNNGLFPQQDGLNQHSIKTQSNNGNYQTPPSFGMVQQQGNLYYEGISKQQPISQPSYQPMELQSLNVPQQNLHKKKEFLAFHERWANQLSQRHTLKGLAHIDLQIKFGCYYRIQNQQQLDQKMSTLKNDKITILIGINRDENEKIDEVYQMYNLNQ